MRKRGSFGAEIAAGAEVYERAVVEGQLAELPDREVGDTVVVESPWRLGGEHEPVCPAPPVSVSEPPPPLIVSLAPVPPEGSVSSADVPLITCPLGDVPPWTSISVAASVAPLCSVARSCPAPAPLPSAS